MTMPASRRRMEARPPDKGSFPLDKDGVCTDAMKNYLRCMVENDSNISKCRDASKVYLTCRMDNNLMAKEDWQNLGFREKETAGHHSQNSS